MIIRTMAVPFALAFAGACPGAAHDISLPAGFDDLVLTEVAHGIYVAHGLEEPPTPANHGFMSNSGVVITEDGVIVVDSGGSAAVSEAILARLAEITDLPVIAIFNTHVHGDHWLGNARILQSYPGIPVYAQARAIERLKSGEGVAWAETFAELTGTPLAPGGVALPTRPVDGNESFTIGGRALHLHHTGHAHTDSDIMLEFPADHLLFTGDIVEYGRAVSSDVPADFSIEGQIKAIEYAMALDVDTFVPGHGPTGGREIPAAALDFLRRLYAGVRKGYDAGLLDYQMRDALAEDLSAYSDWVNFGDLGRLISHTYLQVEAAEFE